MGGMSLERSEQGMEGGTRGEMAAIIFGVPQHASLLSFVADIPSPTSLVPIFSLD